MKTKPIVIEEHTETGVDWLVSVGGSNPEPSDAFVCANKDAAYTLTDLLQVAYDELVERDRAAQARRESRERHDKLMQELYSSESKRLYWSEKTGLMVVDLSEMDPELA